VERLWLGLDGHFKARGRTDRAGPALAARRETILRLCARAGVPLTEDDRTRIDVCAEVATLDRWIDNVFGAKTATDVFT
jgi:hypothetical protein